MAGYRWCKMLAGDRGRPPATGYAGVLQVGIYGVPNVTVMRCGGSLAR